jgi:hypothetical protein
VTPADLPPDAAAELRLLRAEIAAMRAVLQPPVRFTASARPAAPPPRQYRAMKTIRTRLALRAAAAVGPGLILRQRRRALVLLIFGIARVAAWVVLGTLVACGLAGVTDLAWAKTVAESLPFIALISIYANAATDLDGATAAFAALVAADVHHQVVATGLALAADLDAVEADVARLADLDPGDEATILAGDIRRRLAGDTIRRTR